MSTSTGSDPSLELRYPIGKFQAPERLDAQNRVSWIEQIDLLPSKLRAAVEGLDDFQLDSSYRPGGWTVRQVVHHLPDSHINSYCRFRFALTEDSPAIKSYDESAWAKLPDARSAPVALSLSLLQALHGRWVALLRSMTDADFARTFQHPELGPFPLGKALALYAWHGDHHLAQINALRSREHW